METAEKTEATEGNLGLTTEERGEHGGDVGEYQISPRHGAPLVVLGAPLVIDANQFKTSSHDLKATLTEIVDRIRKTPYRRP